MATPIIFIDSVAGTQHATSNRIYFETKELALLRLRLNWWFEEGFTANLVYFTEISSKAHE